MSGWLDNSLEARARRLWDERERGFPKFVRQTWEQGTPFARAAAFAQVARDSGSDRHGENSRSEVEGEASQSGGAAASPTLSSRNPETPNDR